LQIDFFINFQVIAQKILAIIFYFLQNPAFFSNKNSFLFIYK